MNQSKPRSGSGTLLLIRASASRTALMTVRAPFRTRSSGTRSAWTEVATARTRRWPGEDRLFAIEVGFTWLAASAQGAGVNTETKYLLFRHAFEEWLVSRVDLKTDARNERCRAAIAGTGARFEGVLRNWSKSWAPGEDGKLRDSAMFSITAEEWPECRTLLEEKVARTRVRSNEPRPVG